MADARRGGRDKLGCIILGRGEDGRKVNEWLRTAAAVAGFIGFAGGRTTFWDPPVSWRSKTIAREVDVAKIANVYRQWVDDFAVAAFREAEKKIMER